MFAPLLLCLAAAPTVDAPFERFTLSNGLTVILHEDHRLPSVTVNLWFRVGSADEAKGRSGFAHLFEHLMFMGTANVPSSGFDTTMEQHGGSNNATTSEVRTNYFESGPSNLLETFLYLESDRLEHLADDMTKAKLDLQRDVVKNERRQSYENRPYGMSELVLREALFPVGHPHHHTPIGSHEDLTAATVDDVKAFFRRYYVPANASMVIAGDFSPLEARALVQKYFERLKRVEAPPRIIPPTVVLEKPVRLTRKDKVQVERVTLAWLAPGAWMKGEAELELLETALTDGKSGRLVKSLVLEQRLASDVWASYEPMRGQGVLTISAAVQSGHTAAEVEQALEREVAKVVSEGITSTELERSRAVMLIGRLRQLEMASERADLLNELECSLGDPGLLSWAATSRYQSVSTSDVSDIARVVLGRPHVTLTFVPEKKR